MLPYMHIIVSRYYFVHPPFSQVGKILAIFLNHVLIVGKRLTRDGSLALIPNLPTIQFLIVKSVQKQRGVAWSIIYDMNDAVQCLPTSVDSTFRFTSFWSGRRCLPTSVDNAFHFTNIWNSSEIGRYKQKLLSHSFCWGTIPAPCLPMYRHWHHSHDKMEKALPIFAYCKWSKLDGGKPENEANLFTWCDLLSLFAKKKTISLHFHSCCCVYIVVAVSLELSIPLKLQGISSIRNCAS